MIGMSVKRSLCGKCFSPMKGNTCKKCGYTVSRTFSEHDALPVGTKLNGRYIMGKILGKGGFGITYLVTRSKAGLWQLRNTIPRLRCVQRTTSALSQ